MYIDMYMGVRAGCGRGAGGVRRAELKASELLCTRSTRVLLLLRLQRSTPLPHSTRSHSQPPPPLFISLIAIPTATSAIAIAATRHGHRYHLKQLHMGNSIAHRHVINSSQPSRVILAFVKDQDFPTMVASCLRDSEKAIKRKHTTEFENWVARICLKAGGTQVRNQGKSITSKHNGYVQAEIGGSKNNPAKQVHAKLWKLAKHLVGTG